MKYFVSILFIVFMLTACGVEYSDKVDDVNETKNISEIKKIDVTVPDILPFDKNLNLVERTRLSAEGEDTYIKIYQYMLRGISSQLPV